jgi:CO/xanthine dehydrogenase Mo-binding subunit
MIRDVDRRRFLQLTGMVGGGLILGVGLEGCNGTPQSANGADGAFEPNAFVQIGEDGQITIWVSKSELGQGSRTGLSAIVADEMDADWNTVSIRQAGAAADDRFGLQLTGGSLSIRTMWEPLRKAGAVAREMLKAAAAAQWDVAVGACTTDGGVVTHTDSDRSLTYAELASAAAVLPVPDEDDVKLKTPEEFKLVGKSLERIDHVAVLNGQAKFGMDIRVPGMRFCAVARCPIYGGDLGTVDSTAAEALAGVQLIVTFPRREEPFYLAAGVAVIADSTWAAMQGVRALKLNWEKGPNSDASTDALRKTFREQVAVGGETIHDDGNFKKAFDRATVKLEATYELPYLSHSPMEPMNCVAHVTPDGCEIWSPTQNPQEAQRTVAAALNLDPAQVTVHVTLVGGGFGRRLTVDTELEAALIAARVDAPVQVVWTREDDMTHDRYRPSSHHVLRGGLDENGLPVALHWHIQNTDSGRFNASDMPVSAVKNLEVEYTHVPFVLPQGPWRSTVNSQNPFVVHSFMDELARAADRDPVEMWLQLLEDGRSRNRFFETDRQIAVIREAAKRAGWGTPMPSGHGRGFAFFFGYQSYVAEIAEVHVEGEEIHVDRVVCAVDCGTVINPDLATAQIEGGIAFGLNAVLNQQITVRGGRVVEDNFDSFPLLQLSQMPKIEAYFIPGQGAPGGLGEPPLPPIGPAVGNAIFDATGKRLRNLPFNLRDA